MAIEKRTSVPPDGVPILPWFEGAFSRAFVALHPFVFVEGLDPASTESGVLHFNAGDRPDGLDLIEWGLRERGAHRCGKELLFGSVQDIIKRFGEPIRWEAMRRDLDFPDHRSIDRALRTQIGGLSERFADPEMAVRLAAHCVRSKVFQPTEGSFQAILERPLGELLRRLELADVILGDEFGEHMHAVSLEELETGESWSKAQPRRIVANEQSLLALTPWDSFFTIIASSSERMVDAVPDLFEGFWCSNETTTDWCLEPCIPLVG